MAERDPTSLRLRVAGAAPDFTVALLAAVTWIDPGIPGPGMIKFFVVLMFLEFFTLHAGFVVPAGRVSGPGRWILVAFVGVLYMPFVGMLAWVTGEWWPMVAFLVPILNRTGVLVGAEKHYTRTWVIGCAVWLGGMLLLQVLPRPPLGVTDEMAALSGIKGSGRMISEPHYSVAFALLYFGTMAVASVIRRV